VAVAVWGRSRHPKKNEEGICSFLSRQYPSWRIHFVGLLNIYIQIESALNNGGYMLGDMDMD
jgi:hypothetical protein